MEFVRLPAPGRSSSADDTGLSCEWTLEVGLVRVRLSRGTAWDDVSRLLAALRSAP